MKRKTIDELHKKSREELIKELVVKQSELNKLILELSVGKVKNTRREVILKDDIARILTIMKEKEIKKSKPS